jgi:redox-sensitive bicupin YhaK (pirin superfamily)
LNSTRTVLHTWTGKPTREGAGVNLMRIFGYYEAEMMDPFLLLDHFGSSDPEDYVAGFPWHPHRGIETVTYMIDGEVEHGDSLGNEGVIASGDIQWMTAGSGIIHQEMPQVFAGTMRGFQLWVNLPARDKMMRPRYREVSAATVPELELEDLRVKVIAGEIEGVKGPVEDLVVDTSYYDILVPPRSTYMFPVNARHNTFAYIFEGEGCFGPGNGAPVSSGDLALFGNGKAVHMSTENAPMRFILVSGMALDEPIAWRGPIVMNTQEELELAFQEYSAGTFIKENAL